MACRPWSFAACLALLAAGCSAGVADESDKVAVVSGSSNTAAAAPRPVAVAAPPPSPVPVQPRVEGKKLAMPLPRYVPAPPLSPALQAAEDDIKQADQPQDNARKQPPAV